MSLNIKHREAEEFAHLLAKETGRSITAVVTEALRDEVQRRQLLQQGHLVADKLEAIIRHCATLPELAHLSEDEILGYDSKGVPFHGD